MKKIILMTALSLSMTVSARDIPFDSLHVDGINNPVLQRLTPSYTRDFVQVGRFNQHWFIGVQGGASAFLGKPLGCGDIFDRTMPSLNVYGGKWFTPDVGLRVAFQGLKFKDSNLDKNDYQLVHADLMYNMANLFRTPYETVPKWDFIPYLGAGLAHGRNVPYADGTKPRNMQFTLNYGIQTRYHIGERLYLSGELGGFTTFRDFDGYGARGKIGDNMLSMSLGLGVNIGSPRWKHAIDAVPYINQNDYLLSYVERLEASNRSLSNQHNIDRRTLDELKKILEIEGLLGKYGYLFDDSANGKNNYRGLLSLRSRMKGMSGFNEPSIPQELASTPNLLNIPIYFFFKLGKAELTDDSQLINLDELAKVAIEHNLKVHIAGAADSATGSKSINDELSKNRTRFIAKELKKRGVATEKMKGVSLGGISEFTTQQSNRFGKVSLYLEIDETQMND